MLCKNYILQSLTRYLLILYELRYIKIIFNVLSTYDRKTPLFGSGVSRYNLFNGLLDESIDVGRPSMIDEKPDQK